MLAVRQYLWHPKEGFRGCVYGGCEGMYEVTEVEERDLQPDLKHIRCTECGDEMWATTDHTKFRFEIRGDLPC